MKNKLFVTKVREDKDKNGRPIPIYRLTKRQMKLELPEIKKVKL